VINETLARRHWPGASAIGRRIYVGPRLEQPMTIAGVVRDTLGQTETDVVRPQVYLCARQFPSRSMALVVRGADAATLRRAVKEVDAGQPVYSVRTIEDLRADLFAPARVAGKLVMVFGALAVCLAAIGIYSVLAYAVTARRKEFGIRLALGAPRGSLVQMVTARGMKLAGAGFVLGLAGAAGTTRFLSSILYHVSPTDLPTFAATSVLMLAVAAGACWLPARRAAANDPSQILHQD
jgi:putative ABC transport system permease protein